MKECPVQQDILFHLFIYRSRFHLRNSSPCHYHAYCRFNCTSIFRKTTYGRFFYMTGGNREAARLAGIPTDRYRVYAYMISGLLASIGGIILCVRVGTGQVSAGAPLLMDAVARLYRLRNVRCQETKYSRNIPRLGINWNYIKWTHNDERPLLCTRYY